MPSGMLIVAASARQAAAPSDSVMARRASKLSPRPRSAAAKIGLRRDGGSAELRRAPISGQRRSDTLRLTRESRMANAINFPGTVEWSGDNPGISLKETPDGPFVTAASFFRVVLSPFGRGHALM